MADCLLAKVKLPGRGDRDSDSLEGDFLEAFLGGEGPCARGSH